ncbi:MAG: hypothetical protein GXP09_09125 [Gammaproteobacteria bacterium]|nr:hypothetical protein [Gammaproteobacteria bacterium]
MPIVKRTFSIPDKISAELDQTIPNQERSKFIAQTLAEALKQRNRDKLVQAIDDVEAWEPTDEPVVETIRKIREAQSARLADNQ